MGSVDPRYKLFEGIAAQLISSAAAYEEDVLSMFKTYQPPVSHRLPYTPITDNTIGISAFADIDFPKASLAVDIGGGPTDKMKRWVERNTEIKTMLVADPYHRSAEHNESVEKALEQQGGAEIVTSMSVLNVLQKRSDIEDHIRLVNRIIKDGGIAYFKVWAGYWPDRGSGRELLDLDREVYQSNQWASHYLPTIVSVFGSENCYCDMNKNLIVARKYFSPYAESHNAGLSF